MNRVVRRAALLLPLLSAVSSGAALAQPVDDLAAALRAQADRIAALEAQLAALSPGGAPQIAAAVSADRRAERAEMASAASAPATEPAPDGWSFQPIGQIILDATTTGGAAALRANRSNTGARALHAGFVGTVGNGFIYKLETDFAGGHVDVGWAYLGWGGEIGATSARLLIGNLQDDRGVEGSSGGEALPFIEPNFIATAIAPDRGNFGTGAQARATGDGWHVSLSVTGDDVDTRRDASDSRVFLGRAHWNPLRDPDGVVHMGGWAFDEAVADDGHPLGQRIPLAHAFNDAATLDTAVLRDATGDRAYGVELGGVAGRLWAMGELGRRTIRTPGADGAQRAASVSAGLFLTDTRPPYDARSGGFGRPQVARPATSGGPGAIELTARYQTLKLADALGFSGWNTTIGINWYLNDVVRLMANGTYWSRAADPLNVLPREDGQTASARLQIAF